MHVNEKTVVAGDLSLAVKTWGEPGKPAMLALHGWQDNAATFDRLAPLISDYYWIVPDLPGHGLSEHRGKGAEYSIWSYCVEVIALADTLGLDSFTLIGHSMGGGIANLLSAIYPDRIEKLILLDVIGIITTPVDKVLEQMRKGLNQRANQTPRKAGVYPSLDAAITARARKGVDLEAAALLGKRGIAKKDEGYFWRHDQRLTTRSLLSMSDEQVVPFLESVTCPVLLVTSKEAVIREEAIKKRVSRVRNIQVAHLPGGHHQHLDGDIEALSSLIKDFLLNQEEPPS